MKCHFFHRQGLGFLLSVILMCSIVIPKQVVAQTTAGNSVFNFLELPYSAKATALGGINISSMGRDLGLAMFNPSLLDKSMQHQLHLSIKPFYAGIQQYDVSSMYFIEQKKLSIGWGVHYLNYGEIAMTDFAGNQMGTMRPNDYAIQISAAGSYIPNFNIGTNLKYIHSNYGIYKSSGLALDVGLTYLSPNKLSQASVVVKNMGTQLSSSGTRQELPFNLILGWSKKLEGAPIQFSITADRLSLWNNLYYDSSYSNAQGEAAPGRMQNLFNHLTLASEFYIGDQVDIDLGYSFNRRYDLNVQNQPNGLNGFSAGFGLRLERTHMQYGSSFFQRNAYHHFSITYQLKK